MKANMPFNAHTISPKARRLKKLSDRAKDRIFLITLVLPALLLLTFTIGIPIVKSLYMSFFHVTLLKMNRYDWNHFQNFANVLAHREFYQSVLTTFLYVIFVVAIQSVLGLILALILNANLRFRKFFRTLVLIPWIIPTIVSALLWMWLFQPQYGLINYLFQALHISRHPYQWLQDIHLALPAIIVTALWRQLPFMATMLLAGLQGIPDDLYEAARIDGAGDRQLFQYVTLPLLKNTIKTVTLITIIENFKMFPLFWIMTGGGPLNTTTTLAVFSYQTAFTDLNLGKGAAIGALWLIIMLIVAWVYNRIYSIGEEK